jgi:guanylate kinase
MGEAGSGKLIVISAPSGAGKTTIAREIIRLFPRLRFSVSATTRTRRDGESEGVDYYFLTREEFRRRIDEGKFVEWEELFGNLYGTLRSELDAAIRENRHLLFDVDVKGGLSIQRAYPSTLMIFIRPPDLGVLRERLSRRRTETEAMLTQRMERVPMELEEGRKYRHQVVNDDLERAVSEVQYIITEFLTARRVYDPPRS